MRTTAIMNLKGGTGKTVTAINLAAILARDYAMRVLLVDADSQGNLTESMQEEAKGIATGLLSELLQGRPAWAVASKYKNISLLSADPALMGMDISAAVNGKVDKMALADFLEKRADDYDWTIIDCPPAFSASAMAALIAADEVVIPMKLDAFGIRGMANLIEQIRNIRKINAGLEIAGVLPTIVYSDPKQKQAEDDLRSGLNALGIRTFRHIRYSPLVNDTTFAQQPLIYWTPRGKCTYDYKVFVRALAGDPEGGAADGV